MVYFLSEMPNIATELLGRRIADLYCLSRNGIGIVPTLAITTEAFPGFQKGDSFDHRCMTEVLRLLERPVFSAYDQLFVRYSLGEQYLGLEDGIVTDRDYTGVKSAVERIYRSWFGDRARAVRIANSIADEASYPSVMVQPYVENLESLVTRSSDGQPTRKVNFRSNVHNVVDDFEDDYEGFLRHVEQTMRRPSKVYFAKDDGIQIYAVKDQTMTQDGYWYWLEDALASGLIQPREYIMGVTVEMLLHLSGYRLAGSDWAVQGRGVAPGIASGRLVIDPNLLSQVRGEQRILAIDMWSPDYFPLIKECAGVIDIGPFGGSATSHVSFACRGFHIPAVAKRGKVDEGARTLVFDSGTAISEHARVMIDGVYGRIQFSDRGKVEAEYALNPNADSHIQQVLAILCRFQPTAVFQQLPLDIQTHIGRLRYHLRRIGYAV